MRFCGIDYNGGHNFICPCCQTPLKIEWDTEYGDPIIGEEDFECPDCGASTRIQTRIVYEIIPCK